MSHARCACPKDGPRRCRPTSLGACDAPPDLGRPAPARRRRHAAMSSPRGRPPRSNAATHSRPPRPSLRPLPWPSPCRTGEPPDCTRDFRRHGGPPPFLQRGGKHDFGGCLQRRRDRTYATQPSGTDATQRPDNDGTPDRDYRRNRTGSTDAEDRAGRRDHGLVSNNGGLVQPTREQDTMRTTTRHCPMFPLRSCLAPN